MNTPRLMISPRLNALMSYPKFAGAAPRMFVLQSRYWLDEACARAAARLGWEVSGAPAPQAGLMGRGAVKQLFERLLAFKPDFIITVNLAGMDENGLFARLFEDLRIPMAVWFVDDPRTILMGRGAYASPYSAALSWEKGYLPYLRACGFPMVEHMPLAADVALFDAEPADTWSHPPAFTGSAMAAWAEENWAYVRERPRLCDAIRAAFDSGSVTREAFMLGLEHILGADVVSSLDADERRHAELLLFIEGTRRIREELARSLAPEGLTVRGERDWPADIPWGPPVDYERELPAFYRGCEVNLNTTSIQMATAVNQRVFDCPAAGGFLLTDAQADIEGLFDTGRETAVYHSLEECRELLRYYRAHPKARQAIARAARKRILGEHTYEHRLEAIASLLKSRYA